MAMQSLYHVLKEKEAQLQELQRLLVEAQTVLNRVLELNAAASGSTRPNGADFPVTNGSGPANDLPWAANGSTEFP